METILSGVVGSTAYGLSHPGSDIDRLGIFAAPTLDVAGLDWSPRKESAVTTHPDITLHEAGKACRLLLKCNPTVTELLWLGESYEVAHPLGEELVRLRGAFLSGHLVRAAYGGYARSQAKALFTFPPEKAAKHARHVLRLLRQGRQLLGCGELQVRVENPDEYWDLGSFPHRALAEKLEAEHDALMSVPSVLPVYSQRELVVGWLARVRKEFLSGEVE